MTSSSTPISTNLNIVVDTNQFLSVFVFRGKLMKMVFELVIDKKINLYVSATLKDEVLEKLQFYKARQDIRNKVMSFIETKGILLKPTAKVTACRDKEDNFVLELSETAHVEYLVTRDKDLLDLEKWKRTKIIKPEDFPPLLRSRKLL